MKVQLNILPFLGSLAALVITVLTFSGDLQTVVHFSDPLNEIAFAVLAFMLFGCCMVCSFERLEKKS